MLAERIAKLREVLGVHYPSDTLAGRRVAALAFPLLLQCGLIKGSGGGTFTMTFDSQTFTMSNDGWLKLAQKEWEPRT